MHSSWIQANQRSDADDCRFSTSGSDEISLHFPCSWALLCFHSALSAYEAKLKWWWEENSGNHIGPAWSGTSQRWRLARRLPVILISPALTHAHIEIDPLLFGPTTPLPETFWQLWSNRQPTTTHCFTDTHLPLPLSSACVRLPKSHSEIMQTLFSQSEYSATALSSVCVLIFTSFYKTKFHRVKDFIFLVHLETNYNVTNQQLWLLIGAHLPFSPVSSAQCFKLWKRNTNFVL